MAIQEEERRRSNRINLHTPIRYQIRGRPQFDNTISENISLGGLSFLTDKFIALESAIMLEINLLSRLLRPIGKVAWVQSLAHSAKNRVGVEFIELDPQEKGYLKGYLDMQTGKFV